MFLNRRTGRITVAQWPNISLSAFLAASIATRIAHPAGTAGTVLRAATIAALAVWAIDEMIRGVNPFRRLLGLAILAATVAGIAPH